MFNIRSLPKLSSLLIICICLLICSCQPTRPPAPPPTLTTISPASGVAGTMITISGQHFESLTDSAGCIKIYFQNKWSCGTRNSSGDIVVNVPFEAGDGPLCINFNGVRLCTNQSFNYIPGNANPNSFMRLADAPNTPTNQIAVMVATDDAILAGFINWWRYNIDLNTWTPMPAPMDKVARATSFTFNGKAYVFGGYSAAISNKLQCFDPATNSWSYKAPMPSLPRGDASAFVYNNKVYIAGGNDTYTIGMNTVARQLWEYDPVADTWQRKADMPEGAIEGYYAVRIGQKFYFPSRSFAGVQEYDPATNTWRQLNPASSYLPPFAIGFADKDFPFAYTIEQRQFIHEQATVRRHALGMTGNETVGVDYGFAPGAGWGSAANPLFAVLNNEVYYGMNHFDVNGVLVQTNQFWRYRY